MKTLLTSALVFICGFVSAQNIGINTDGSAPHLSSILELKSDNRGFLPPRLTTVQRDGILAPATGLLIYNTDTGCLNIYDGFTWRDYCPDLTSYDCPLGMVDMGHYSIEQNYHPATDFFSAVVDCRNLGPRVRLCTVAEWYYACQTGLVPSMVNDFEWVDDVIQENTAISFGGGSCTGNWSSYVYSDRFFRCCCEH